VEKNCSFDEAPNISWSKFPKFIEIIEIHLLLKEDSPNVKQYHVTLRGSASQRLEILLLSC
jgi:hypothetical protein